MRVGLISPPWVAVPPPAYGGTEAVVDRLARGLVAAGHEVLLAAPAGSRCPVPQVPGMGVPDPDNIGKALTEVNHVVRGYAAMGDMDVIHDHTIVGPLYRHRPAGPRVVVTSHGPFLPAERDLFQVIQRDAAVVAISRHQASTATGIRIARVIHHGIDVQDIPVGTGGDYACFVGRMHPCKGVRHAIDVARAAGVPLRIAAKMREPAEYDYYRSEVEPHLDHDIRYLGELGPADKYALMGGACALLNPIQWAEPFGLVMIEALATGTPVVTTHQGSAPEIIDDGRTGVLRDTPTGLAAGLLQAARLDRAHCRAVAVDRFSIERMIGTHLDLYTDLMTTQAVPDAQRTERRDSFARRRDTARN